MDSINFNFDIKTKHLNSDNIKDIKQKQDISNNNNIQPEYAKVDPNLLPIYKNVSFKGQKVEVVKPEFRSIYLNSFKQFNDAKKWNYFIDTLCKDYKEEEIVEILDAVKNQSDKDKNACNTFLLLINIGQKDKLTYNSDPNAKGSIIILERELTPLEAKELIVNGFTKNSDIQKYIELSKAGYSLEEAINVIKYGVKNDDIDKFRELSSLEFVKDDGSKRQITPEEAIVCIAFSFDEQSQIENFIRNIDFQSSSHSLSLYEAALCTAKNFDKSQINEYFDLKSKNFPISAQEAILCLDSKMNEDNIRRYCSLRDKHIQLEGVRTRNKSEKFNTNNIIGYINSGKTDEEIGKEFRLYALLENGLSNDDALLISEYEDLTNLLVSENSEYSVEQIVKCAKLGLTSKSQIEQIAELINEGKKPSIAVVIVKYGMKDIESNPKFQELLAQGLSTYQAADLTCDADMYSRFEKIKNSSVSWRKEEIALMGKMGYDKFEQLEKHYQICSVRHKDMLFREFLLSNDREIPFLVKYKYLDEVFKKNDQYDFSDYSSNEVFEISKNNFSPEQIKLFREIKASIKDTSVVDEVAAALVNYEYLDDVFKIDDKYDFNGFNKKKLLAIAKNNLTIEELAKFSHITQNNPKLDVGIVASLIKNPDFSEEDLIQNYNNFIREKREKYMQELVSRKEIEKDGNYHYIEKLEYSEKEIYAEYTQEQKDSFNKLIQQGINAKDAIYIAGNTSLIKMLEEERKITATEAYDIVKNSNLDSLDFNSSEKSQADRNLIILLKQGISIIDAIELYKFPQLVELLDKTDSKEKRGFSVSDIKILAKNKITTKEKIEAVQERMLNNESVNLASNKVNFAFENPKALERYENILERTNLHVDTLARIAADEKTYNRFILFLQTKVPCSYKYVSSMSKSGSLDVDDYETYGKQALGIQGIVNAGLHDSFIQISTSLHKVFNKYGNYNAQTINDIQRKISKNPQLKSRMNSIYHSLCSKKDRKANMKDTLVLAMVLTGYPNIISVFSKGGKYNFAKFSDKELFAIAYSNLNKDEVQNYKKIKSKIANFDDNWIEPTVTLSKYKYLNEVFFNNNEVSFETFDNEAIKAMVRENLTQEQVNKFYNLLKTCPSVNRYTAAIVAKSEKFDELFTSHNGLSLGDFLDSSFETIINFNNEQMEKFYSLISKGIDPNDAVLIAVDKRYIEMVGKSYRPLSPKEAAIYATESEYSFLDPTYSNLLDEDVLWCLNTGEPKTVFEIFEKVLQKTDFSDAKKLSASSISLDNMPNCSFNENGIFKYEDGDKSFEVKLKTLKIDSKTVLLIEKDDGEKYIAYDGAIVPYRTIETLDKEKQTALSNSLLPHVNIPNCDNSALPTAAKHFVLDILEKENGSCIISQGIPEIKNGKSFIGKSLDTEETKEKYRDIFKELKLINDSDELRFEDILRIMPKDAMLNIRPYATSKCSSDILYSISAEWYDKEDVLWEMRIHSEDLNHIGDNSKPWIFRLGYNDKNNPNDANAKSYYYDKADEYCVGTYREPYTHIKLKTPEKLKDKLISNPIFQKNMRDISISLNDKNNLEDVANYLNVHEESLSAKKARILQMCETDITAYYKYRDIIDSILKEQGLPSLNFCHT